MPTPIPGAVTDYDGLQLRASRYGAHRTPASPYATLRDDGDVDRVAVQRFTEGHPCKITAREYVCVVYALATAGMSDAEIAGLLACDRDAIQKVRKRHNIDPGAPAPDPHAAHPNPPGVWPTIITSPLMRGGRVGRDRRRSHLRAMRREFVNA